ncbi:TetR/AcrR family transcriptional regulator [Marinicrinis sediminis]|uniref:TetR/AcrR family transcriptional regulator n=1 Tax=Marinicrinis sediminis TaxID=1652465 RepID=A0ABW5RFV5_9BACL
MGQVRQEERRKVILGAAVDCFLQYGYAKTAMDDIAKKASISRSLLYIQFKNKEDILVNLLQDLWQQQMEQAAHILDREDSLQQKLIAIFDVLVIQPWEQFANQDGQELLEEYVRLFPQFEEAYRKDFIEVLMTVLNDRQLAEVMMLSVKGLKMDHPTLKVLRERIQVLVTRLTSSD